jgi:hypothetical protein
VSSHPIIRLDASECSDLARTLGDTPRTVIAVHLLRRGMCSAYAVGDLGCPDAVVVQPTSLPEEPMAYGTDAGAIWRVLADLSGWACISVDSEVAGRLGPIVEASTGRPVRYIDDIHHTLDHPAIRSDHTGVRSLKRDDLDLLASAPTEIRELALGFGSLDDLFAEGVAAGAVIDGGLVALACTTAQSLRHADLSVVTAGPWRGRGLATACAALVAEEIRRAGRVPVWSAGEQNAASLRVARKLGFEEVGRRVYIIPL